LYQEKSGTTDYPLPVLDDHCQKCDVTVLLPSECDGDTIGQTKTIYCYEKSDFSLDIRVARWCILKPKIQIWVNF
jgi:hypothetical protein